MENVSKNGAQPLTTMQMVEQFHKVFGHPIADKPTVIPLDRLQFRMNAIKEELAELAEAVSDNDIVLVADAIADISYFANGFWIEAGLQPFKQAIMEEVNRSNMSKSCSSVEEAEATVAHIAAEYGWRCTYENIDGRYVVKRGDGKVMKNINYSPANLAPIIFATNEA